MLRKLGWSAAALLALVAGILMTQLTADQPASFAPVPVAWAINCQPANDTCGSNDLTKTSVMTVKHETTPVMGSDKVEPDTGETWTITATWVQATQPIGQCQSRNETAYVDVDWSGTGWTTSNESLTTNILDIAVCDVAMCESSGGAKHGHSYKLFVDITDITSTTFNLQSVAFVASNIDDGNVLDPAGGPTDCEQLGATVSPVASTYSNTDSPGNWTNRCPFACNTGGSTPSVTITYQ